MAEERLDLIYGDWSDDEALDDAETAAEDVATAAAGMLADAVGGASRARARARVRVAPELVARASTAAPPAA